MKVPTYERQVGESADTGSRTITAQVSPSSMAAPFQATAQLGNEITKAGLQWYGHELKLKRSIEETNASTTLAFESKRLANKVTLGETQEDGTFIPPVSPKDMTTVYKFELNKIVQNLNTNFKDKVAQKRFMAKVSSLVANDQLGVMKLSRNALVDERQAQFNTELDALVDTLTTAIPGTYDYNDAFSKLYGDDGKTKNAFGLGEQTRSPVKSIFQKMVDEGIYSNVDAQKLRLATEENIEIQSITKELIRAEDTDDETIFDNLEDSIQKNKKLDTLTKTSLLKQVDSKRDTWVNAKNREEERAERLNLKRIKAKQNTNYSKLFSRIIANKTTEDPDERDPVTIFDLNNLLNNQGLTPAMFDTLNALIKESDAQTTDGFLKKDLFIRILDADVTNDELDNIIAEVPTYFGFQGRLKFNDGFEIIKYAENRKKGTRDTETEDYYLKSLISDLDALLPDRDNDQYIILKTQAIQDYTDQILEVDDTTGVKKYKPKDIYDNIVDRVKQSTGVILKFPLYPKAIPEDWKKIPVATLTLDNLKLLETNTDSAGRNWFDSNNENYNGLTLTEIERNIKDLRVIDNYIKKFNAE
tara:strand:+ start:11124 stop:12884 length:1761 start_codon:yes stop_codon:yes gene_type:complete